VFAPPAILLDDCRLPSRDGAKTVGDLVQIIVADETAINEHNANMQILREYRASLLKMGRQDAMGN